MKLTWLLYISHCILQLTALYSWLLCAYHSFQQLIALYSWWLCNNWLHYTAGCFVHIKAFNNWLLCTADGFVTIDFDCSIQLAALCILLLCTANCFVHLAALYRCWLCKRDQVTVFFFRIVYKFKILKTLDTFSACWVILVFPPSTKLWHGPQDP